MRFLYQLNIFRQPLIIPNLFTFIEPESNVLKLIPYICSKQNHHYAAYRI